MALKMVGNAGLADYAEHNAEAAFRVYIHRHQRRYTDESKVCSAGS